MLAKCFSGMVPRWYKFRKKKKKKNSGSRTILWLCRCNHFYCTENVTSSTVCFRSSRASDCTTTRHPAEQWRTCAVTRAPNKISGVKILVFTAHNVLVCWECPRIYLGISYGSTETTKNFLKGTDIAQCQHKIKSEWRYVVFDWAKTAIWKFCWIANFSAYNLLYWGLTKRNISVDKWEQEKSSTCIARVCT